MDTEELARLVKKTRDAQKKYFKSRDSGAPLRESKDWERRLDAAVEEILNPGQPSLFDPPGR